MWRPHGSSDGEGSKSTNSNYPGRPKSYVRLMVRRVVDLHGLGPVLGQLSRFVTIIAAMAEDEPIGMSIEPMTAARTEPPFLMVPFTTGSLLKRAIVGAGGFSANCVDSSAHEDLCRSFAAMHSDGWDVVAWNDGPNGPNLEDAVACVSCSFESELKSGLFEFVVARVEAIDADLEALAIA
jgi:3-hydroxy-9,10-secoandrosta-1,3,5(10)-triene-9,17-dione monooxygenase reductase component